MSIPTCIISKYVYSITSLKKPNQLKAPDLPMKTNSIILVFCQANKTVEGAQNNKIIESINGSFVAADK